MAEQLYTIPVNEAFEEPCECALCKMYRTLEANAIEFTMGPSYMEDDVRIETNRLGFCENHIKMLYHNQNRLGLALMMLSHTDRTVAEMEKRKGKHSKGGLFSKNSGDSPMKELIDGLTKSCYICNRIENTFDRYVATIFYLYQREDEFVKKFDNSLGFCTKHYALLYERAPGALHGSRLEQFSGALDRQFFSNMQRVRDDLKWFIDKFDYRYVNEPWKNSKDALPRTIMKMNSTDVQ